MPRTALAVATALLAVTACSSGHAPSSTSNSRVDSSEDYCAGTTYGSQVVLYSTKNLEYWYTDVLTTFQANCGVRVVYVAAPGPEIEHRLAAEKAAPYADVLVAEAADMTTADLDGLLEPDGAPGSQAVPDERCGPQRHWCDVLENFVSLVYNPKLVQEPPRTLQDLLAPRFAQRILLSDLHQAEDGRSLLDLLDVILGRDGALRFITQLEPSVRTHWITTDTMSRLVAAGSALVANGNLHEDLNDIEQYHNVAIWFPRQGSTPTTLATPFGAALVRGGHNRADAVALLKYMWSKAGQSAAGSASAMPARPDVVPDDCRSRDVRKRLADVRVVRPDWERVARDERFLDDAWVRLRRAPDGTPPPPTALPPLQRC
jgi:2-aminoethylphosphonate transport system substrate-binding protein